MVEVGISCCQVAFLDKGRGKNRIRELGTLGGKIGRVRVQNDPAGLKNDSADLECR